MHYKIYLLDETDHIVGAQDQNADADIDILTVAKTIAIKEGPLEVWQHTDVSPKSTATAPPSCSRTSRRLSASYSSVQDRASRAAHLLAR